MTSARQAQETRPLRVMRAQIVEDAANTLTELAFNTPIEPGTFQVLRIKGVSMQNDVQGALESTLIGVAGTIVQASLRTTLNLRQGLTVLPTLNTPGTLYRRDDNLLTGEGAAGSQVGGLAYTMSAMPGNVVFPGEGILIATRQLSLYTQGINMTVGFANTAQVQIYYDVIRVTADELFGVLSVSETF